MKFSIWPNMSRAPHDVLDLARWADSNGWYGIWYADHYMTNSGTEEPLPGDAHECWAMLPAIAAVTERIRLGSLVSPTSIHHPAVLANRARTVDHISRGRLVLGLGAGWQINEHHAFGIELEEPAQRVTRFDEAIQIIRSLLAEDRTTFSGAVYTIDNAPCDPPPIQSPLPILVGTSGRRMLKITARYANEWNTWGGPGLAAHTRKKLDEACAAVDRDPATMHTSVQAVMVLSDDAAEVEAAANGPMKNRTVAGNAEQLIETMSGYIEAGFDEFILPDWNLSDDAGARFDQLARIQHEVFDAL